MTDITELAQREKFEAWFKSSFHPDKTGPYIKDQLYFAWKAAGAELVEALEKAQAKADIYDMLRDDYGLREKGVGLADFVDWQAKRIAELEESHAQVIQSRDHYKRMSEEGLKQLAESRTVTVKLLKRKTVDPYSCDQSSNCIALGYNEALVACRINLDVAGIKVESE